MKRVLASASLGKEVTVSATCEERGAGPRGGRGRLPWLRFIHTPETWDLGQMCARRGSLLLASHPCPSLPHAYPSS